jgi:hypothetical protein
MTCSPPRHQRLRAAEIHQHRAPAGLAHHVVRLDVAVQQPGGVEGGERAAEIDADAGHLASAQRPGVADHRAQGPPFDAVHPDADAALVLVGAVDRHHIRVPDPGEVAGLAQRSAAGA